MEDFAHFVHLVDFALHFPISTSRIKCTSLSYFDTHSPIFRITFSQVLDDSKKLVSQKFRLRRIPTTHMVIYREAGITSGDLFVYIRVFRFGVWNLEVEYIFLAPA